jgi:xanthine dehydrogenase YagR molybdenum-binding subunit
MAAIADRRCPVYGLPADEVEFKDGKITAKSGSKPSEAFADLVARSGNRPIEGYAEASLPKDINQYSRHSFGAIFVEALVDPDLGTIRVPRIVAVYDVGRLLNTKTGINQFIGGIVWGVSLALHEDTYVDERTGRIANANLAAYRVPVNADIGDIDVSAIDTPDTKFNRLGARGIGEIGITGTGAAVANAIFHATGIRVRDLPITLDKLLV